LAEGEKKGKEALYHSKLSYEPGLQVQKRGEEKSQRGCLPFLYQELEKDKRRKKKGKKTREKKGCLLRSYQARMQIGKRKRGGSSPPSDDFHSHSHLGENPKKKKGRERGEGVI